MAAGQWKEEPLPPGPRIVCVPLADARSLEAEVMAATADSTDVFCEQRMRLLLSGASQSWDHLWYFLDILLGKRIKEPCSWPTAVKGLLLLHQLLRRGSRVVENDILQLLESPENSHLLANFRSVIRSFTAELGRMSQEQAELARAYSLFILERMKCAKVVSLVSWARRPKVVSPPAQEVESAVNTVRGTDPDSFNEAYWKTLSLETILRQVRCLQELLERLLACQPAMGEWLATCPVLVNALEFVLRDSFDLYSSINYAMVELVERFGSLAREQAFECLAIYRRAALQAENLALLYHRYGKLGIGRGINFPKVATIGGSYLQSLEDYLVEDPSGTKMATGNPSLALVPKGSIMQSVRVPGQPQPPDAARAAEITAAAAKQFDETWCALFATDKYSTPSNQQAASQPQQVSLYGAARTSNESTRWPYQGPSGSAAAFQQRASWEGSSHSGQSSQVPGMGNWEVALASQPTSTLVPLPQPVLPRGFDQLLLDSLYEAAQAQRRVYSGIATGAAGGVGMLETSQQQQGQGPDPFIASANIAPPPYVQMAIRAQQQMAMLLQQRMMAQHSFYSSVLKGDASQQPADPFHNCRNVDNIGVRYGSVLVPYS